MDFDQKTVLKKSDGEAYEVLALWTGEECRLKLKSRSERSIFPEKIVLFSMDMIFSPNTLVYGEGYNKLSQYEGTVSNIKLIGKYGDFSHYKLSKPDGFQQVYNMIRFSPEGQEDLLMGFTSCYRFNGEFWFNEQKLQVILNLEGIEILPGEEIELEHFFMGVGKKTELESRFSTTIQKYHPKFHVAEIPTGWCSWPVYGPQVTEQDIYKNLKAIKEKKLGLKYIQIDDGYQPYMGDWLSSARTFKGGVEKLCHDIKNQGFEPAIWVAPFIAEEQSELFQYHSDWFVKDDEGKPLASDRISFGGWRCAPWYMLDGTHPDARKYLTHVFKTMRQQWGVKYFKLDANMWGALPFGKHFEKNRTCVEAYRMGMNAILEGAGEESFLLGCNAPMWPSLGLVHGMRVTNDNARTFPAFSRIAKECFHRNWQNESLWINDPDTLLQRNRKRRVLDPAGNKIEVSSDLRPEEFQFYASYILASGGMVLSGDVISDLTEEQTGTLRKLLSLMGKAAVFDTEEMSAGRIQREGETLICLFNDGDSERAFLMKLEKKSRVIDFWLEEELGIWEKGEYIVNIFPHSARVLKLLEYRKKFS